MRLAYRPRQHAHVAELKVLSLETESLSGPRLLENLDRLQRTAESLRARHAEALELLGAVAEPNPEPKPAARDYVDEGCVLGQLQRMPKRREQDVGADADSRRARGDSGSGGRQRGQIAVVGEVMFGEPNGIEAELLGRLNLRQRLVIKFAKRKRRTGRIAEIELIANFHLAHDSPRGRDPQSFLRLRGAD